MVVFLGWFIAWVFVSLFIGFLGINKRIGYGKTFLISLFLTPIAGVIAASCSTSCEDFELEQEKIKLLKELRDKIVGVEKKVLENVDENGEFESLDGKVVKYDCKIEFIEDRERIKVVFDNGKEGNLYPIKGTLEYSFIAAGKFISYEDKISALRALYHYVNTFEVTDKGRTSNV